MLARYLKLAVGLAVVSAASPLFAGAADAAPAIGGFSVRPVETSSTNPATRAYFVQTLRRGIYVRDEVLVGNLSNRRLRLRVYPVDGVTGVTSGAVYTNQADKLRAAGRWLRADVQFLTLAAHQQALVPFVVGVPHAAKAGDHLAGLAVENLSHTKSGGHFSITEVVREVVGVEVQVPGAAAPQLKLKGLSLAALPGTQIPSVIVDLGDSGLKLCKPRLAVTLSGSGINGTVVRPLDTVLPGNYIPYPVPWPRALPSGVYRASAMASGCGHRVRTSSVVQLGAALSGTAAHPGYGTTPQANGVKWWMIALVALGGLGAGVGATLRVSRRRPRRLSTSS